MIKIQEGDSAVCTKAGSVAEFGGAYIRVCLCVRCVLSAGRRARLNVRMSVHARVRLGISIRVFASCFVIVCQSRSAREGLCAEGSSPEAVVPKGIFPEFVLRGPAPQSPHG
jgi:hypothetical protein